MCGRGCLWKVSSQGWTMVLIHLLSLSFKLALLTCSVIIELGLVNIAPFLAGIMLVESTGGTLKVEEASLLVSVLLTDQAFSGHSFPPLPSSP